MNVDLLKSAMLLLVGFGVGSAVSIIPHVSAANSAPDLSHKHFRVSVDEIRQNFVFDDEFVGHYAKTVTLSDGKTRSIELTPMVHEGKQVVEFKDTGGHTYMSLSGTTTNGTLMVQVSDVDAVHEELRAQGWHFAER